MLPGVSCHHTELTLDTFNIFVIIKVKVQKFVFILLLIVVINAAAVNRIE